MSSAIKYMIDEKGTKTSVLVPLKTWEKMTQDYSRMQKKLQILSGIKAGLDEVKAAKKSGRKLQTLKEFLRDSNG